MLGTLPGSCLRSAFRRLAQYKLIVQVEERRYRCEHMSREGMKPLDNGSGGQGPDIGGIFCVGDLAVTTSLV